MKETNENLKEAASISSFQDRLALTKRRLIHYFSELTVPTSLTDPIDLDIKLSISDLPLQVKKHFITAGIIQGEIFDKSGAFTYISTEDEGHLGKSAEKKPQILHISGPNYKSLIFAVDAVEQLLNDVITPETPSKKRKLWKNEPSMCQLDYEIKDFSMEVINTLIVKGIIQGQLYSASGATVIARGSPHLSNPPPNERLLYFHIQGPDHQSTLNAIQAIDKMINEVESLKGLNIKELIANNTEITTSKQSTHQSAASAPQNVHSLSIEKQQREPNPAEQNSLTDVIQQLKQYIEGSGEAPGNDDQMKEKNFELASQPTAVSMQPLSDNTQSQSTSEDVPLTDIIQQLQQYIGESRDAPRRDEQIKEKSSVVLSQPATVSTQPLPVVGNLDSPQSSQNASDDVPLTDIIQQLQQILDKDQGEPMKQESEKNEAVCPVLESQARCRKKVRGKRRTMKIPVAGTNDFIRVNIRKLGLVPVRR